MGLAFYDTEVSNDEYKQIKNYMLPLLLDVSNYFKIKLSEVRWNHVYEFAEDILNYDILFYDFGPIISRQFSGRTKLIDGEVSIIINSNELHKKERQHFTLMHEIVHAYIHIKNSVHPIFASSTRNLSPEDVQVEIEADIGASILMANDKALQHELEENKSFYSLCNKFSCSYSSMFMRLRNFLCFEYNMSGIAATYFVREFQNWSNNSLNIFVKYAEVLLLDYVSYLRLEGISENYISLEEIEDFIDWNLDVKTSEKTIDTLSNYIAYRLEEYVYV